jgi:hypothetical protein
VLLDLGGGGAEVFCNEGPGMLDTSEGISEDDKMLLNCLEHVSYMRVCYLIGPVKLNFSFSLKLIFVEGSNNG